MIRVAALTLFATLLATVTFAQSAQPPVRPPDFAKILQFEATPAANGMPGGWFGGPPATISVDNAVLHDGHRSVRIERTASSANGFSTLTARLPMDFAGTSVQLRGFLRTEDVDASAGLWLREDADSKSVAFDNMKNQNLHGTTDWKEYSITLPVRRNADALYFGVLLEGKGKLWISGLQLLVDGLPISDTLAATDRNSLPKMLSFEYPHAGNVPANGWEVNPDGAAVFDDTIVHNGKSAVRIVRKPGDQNSVSVIRMGLPRNFTGTTLELRGFLRTADVTGYAGVFLRQMDVDNKELSIETMAKQELKGTHDWAEYRVTLPLHPQAALLYFGARVGGSGTVWVDDFTLLVDGKPFQDAPRIQLAIDYDHEFDQGSKFRPADLSAIQIQNLATLGRVWGYLKYNHPLVVAGERHFDYDLLRVLPTIAAAPDRATANAALVKWIATLGDVPVCKSCATLVTTDLHLKRDVAWISSEELLGAELSKVLRTIESKRAAVDTQFYIRPVQGVSNPIFEHELDYKRIKMPDAGFQLLGLFRLWNMIAYWYPNRDILGEDWNQVLADFIPRVGLASEPQGYPREMIAFIAKIHDTHANLWSSLNARPPLGACQLPVDVRFVEDRPVVVGFSSDAGAATGLRPGDAITALDGVPVGKLIQQWLPYYAASNPVTQLRDIAGTITTGACEKSKLTILRDKERLEISADRVPSQSLKKMRWHDLPGETYRLLSPDVAYIKLSSVKAEDPANFVKLAAGTKGIIIDIRNYPSTFMPFALGQLLIDKETPFVRFTTADLANPGAFHWGEPLVLHPMQPHYAGKIMILVDEVSVSQAEYTAMALRSAPGAKVIGSTTAGADGNVSQIPLPGGLSTGISGIGVFYPDKKPTQRIGILPDLVVKPTIAGIRAGRDEVLEAAIKQIVPDAP